MTAPDAPSRPMGVDLVTGGAGFIGSELVSLLVRRGRQVIVLDDLSTGVLENLAHLPSERVELIVGDVRDERLTAACAREVDTVYHLAGVDSHRSIHDAHVAHDVNATGTLVLLAAARAAGVIRWVQVSSAEVYGGARYAPMDEAHPTEPTTATGASKLAGEAYARAHHSAAGLQVVIVRPFNVYGPQRFHQGDRGDVIPTFVLGALCGRDLAIFGDGTQTRDFIHVADAAAGIAAAGASPVAAGRTFNLGSGRQITIAELARLVVSLVGETDAAVVHRAPRPGDVVTRCADSSAARRDLGFVPSRPLADGIRELAEHMRRDPRGTKALSRA